MFKAPIHFAKPYLMLCIILVVIALVFRYVRFAEPELIYVKPFPEDQPHKQEITRLRKSLFMFDPNTIDSSALDSLAIPKRLAFNLLKYRKAGGLFHATSDFKKLYGMNDSLFRVIEPYIVFSKLKKDTVTYRKKTRFLDRKHEPVAKMRIDLNLSSAEELTIPRLVGCKRSEAIIKYRERLGGFYAVSQLSEVYAIGDSLLPYIEDYYIVDSASIIKRNIRDQTWSTLVTHPYIDKYLAKHVLLACKISPDIQTLKQLLDSKVLDSATYSKLKYYFN